MANGEPTAAEIAASGPPVSGVAPDAPGPIGVPEGYGVTKSTYYGTPFGTPRVNGRRLGIGSYQVPPRYTDGMEYWPASLSIEDRVRLQETMVAKGVFEATDKFRVGIWDKRTTQRWRELLEFANAAGLTWQEALEQYPGAGEFGTGGGGGGGGAGGGRPKIPPLTVRLTNPDDIKRVAEDSAQRVLGRRLDDESAQRFVALYQSMERSAQTAAHGATYGEGGTVTNEPSIDVAAENFARQSAPVEAEANDLGRYYDMFAEIISTPGLT